VLIVQKLFPVRVLVDEPWSQFFGTYVGAVASGRGAVEDKARDKLSYSIVRTSTKSLLVKHSKSGEH
jgi:hypothetical protein